MKNIKIILLNLLIVFSLASCSDDYFDSSEADSLTPAEAFADANLVNASIMGVYDRFQNSSYLGRDYLVYPEIASDNAKMNALNSGRFIQEYNFSLIASSADALGTFESAYEVIHACNLIIDNIESCSDCSDDEKNRALGHAYGLRALAHFDLVRLFAFPYNLTDNGAAPNANGAGGHLGIPLITNSVAEENPARNTVAEVYTQIINDLNTSVDRFENLSFEGTSFFSDIAAKALLARVYLYMDNYDNAAFFANFVINNSSFSLVPNSSYLDSWNQVGSSETIFELSFTANDYPSTNALGYIYNGYKDILVSDNFYNTLGVDDIRLGLYEPYQTSFYLNNKFAGRESIVGLANSPVLRLSEMYLIKAEAEAKIGGSTMENSARIALDAIKQRANPSEPATTASGSDLISEVALERRKELAFEGHRLFDLLRYKEGVHRDPSDVIGTAPLNVEYPSHKLIFPIPQDEVNANPNMVQNLGY